METLGHILNGFSVCLQPINLWYTFVGVLIGTIVGILPGIGPSASIALLIPMTFGMDPTSGLIMMAGIYYGTKYGGSATAILIRTPGEASSVMTTLDGYEMARNGRASALVPVLLWLWPQLARFWRAPSEWWPSLYLLCHCPHLR